MQPVLAGSRRAEFYWEGPAGTGAALATAIRGWEHLRFEVSEDPSARSDGGRWMHTPGLGIHFAQTDTGDNINGAVYFDNRYLGNPLVFCGCVGILPRNRVEKAARPGDLVDLPDPHPPGDQDVAERQHGASGGEGVNADIGSWQ